MLIMYIMIKLENGDNLQIRSNNKLKIKLETDVTNIR